MPRFGPLKRGPFFQQYDKHDIGNAGDLGQGMAVPISGKMVQDVAGETMHFAKQTGDYIGLYWASSYRNGGTIAVVLLLYDIRSGCGQ